MKKTFYAAHLRIMYETENSSSTSQRQNTCIFEFTCICGSKYIGRTERCLPTRIREYLPKGILNSVDKTPQNSITEHLLDSEHSTDFINSFKVINKHSKNQLFEYAEACAIRIYRPNLCIQKDMFDNLSLPW